MGEQKIGDPWTTKDFQWDVVSAKAERRDRSLDLTVRVLWKSRLWADGQGVPKPLVDERTTIRIHAASESAPTIMRPGSHLGSKGAPAQVSCESREHCILYVRTED